MTQEEIKNTVKMHAKWLIGDSDGVCADLRWADLRGADLRWADLRAADLRGADLRAADLRGANLSCASAASRAARFGTITRWKGKNHDKPKH